jgi:hypothetical protein
VCPPEARKVITRGEVMDYWNPPDGMAILDAWVNKLNGIEERCVEFGKDDMQIFDMW